MPAAQLTRRELGIPRPFRNVIRDGLACSDCTPRPDPHERHNLYNRCLSRQLPVARNVVTSDLGRRNRSVFPFSFGSRMCVRQVKTRNQEW